MPLLISFANPLTPPSADRISVGALNATLPVAVSTAMLTTAASPANALLLFGDNTSGVVQWTDQTAAANSGADNDTVVFNSTGDQYFVELAANDILESLDWFVTTAGVYTGTVTATVAYRDLSGVLQQQTGLVMPSLTSTGLKRLMLAAPIDVASVGLADDPRDPTATRVKALFVKFLGITAMTTPPLAQRFWKRRTASAPKAVTDVTAVVGTGDKTPFAAFTVLPLSGDLSLMGTDAKSAAAFTTITRSRSAALASELVYSKGAGQFGTIPLDDLTITSGINGSDELWTAPIGNYVDTWMPPADWVKDTITAGAVTHNKYWLGWRYTADAAAPVLALTVELRNVLLAGSGSRGVPSLENATYTKFEMLTRTACPSAVWLVVSNKRTEQTVSIKLAANTTYATVPVSFPVLVGDDVIMQVVKSDPLFHAADGMIRLS